MKQIKGIVTGIVQVNRTHTTNVTQAMQLKNEARQNKAKVLDSALTIENQLSSILGYYFFGQTHERKSTFEALILNSPLCTFSEKRKLIEHVINEQALLSGQEKNSFVKSLRDVMKYRNACAHGTLSSDDTTVWLSYFDGTPRKDELDDDYLSTVEKTIFEVFNSLNAIEASLKGIGPPPPLKVS